MISALPEGARDKLTTSPSQSLVNLTVPVVEVSVGRET